MFKNRVALRAFLATALAIVTAFVPLAATRTSAQQHAPAVPVTQAADDLTAKLAVIEKAIDERRKELGVPGAALAIVKDDQVIYLKGLGVKDFEKQSSVTPDTLFAIGSASKAFTGLAAVMAADQGKLSLEDSPKKFLPYFRMRDPEADEKINLRDLLAHRSGLNRTDIAWATGKLTREELIKVAGMAKPASKLREKFLYQNIMYAAAGEMIARAQNSTWDKVVATQIFKPLGMTSSGTTVSEMQAAKDFSHGHDYNDNTKQTRKLPMRDFPTAAPAGAINSSARDMAQWVRFMLGDGSFNGKRLVSAKNFAELTEKQMRITDSVSYGLGWFLRSWDGHKVVDHGGNIDGFNAQVAMMPDQKLGFVLLTNVTASPLGSFAMNTIWTNLVGRRTKAEPAKTVANAAVEPKDEVGTYHLAEAKVDFTVAMTEGKLTLSVPGQPAYPLELVSGRRYKLGAPAPDGFYATFRPVAGKENETEMYLEQPQGNVAVIKVKASEVAKPAESYPSALAETIGTYENSDANLKLEIAVKDGKVSLIVPGQPAYPLVERGKDKLASPALPETYWVDLTRDAGGKITGLVMNQPGAKLSLQRLLEASISADDLIAKIIAAHGGEENLRRYKTMVSTIEIDMESQGVTGIGTVYAKAPGSFASHVTLMALGKELGTIVNYFDGTKGGQVISFAPEEVFSGKQLEDLKRETNFYGPLSWKEQYKTITIKGVTKVGDEEAYILEKVPEKGNKVTDYVSKKTMLLLRRDSLITNESQGLELPQTHHFSDYREVGGMMVPFKTRSYNLANGEVVTVVKDVKFDVDVPDERFKRPKA